MGTNLTVSINTFFKYTISYLLFKTQEDERNGEVLVQITRFEYKCDLLMAA